MVYSHHLTQPSLNKWVEYVDMLVMVVSDIAYRWWEFNQCLKHTSFSVHIWKKLAGAT